jgi:hypothetical protein
MAYDPSELHAQIFEVLLEKVREDPFPSVTMLNMLESMLQEDDVEAYTAVLMDKIREVDFPSIDQLRRLQNFA